MKRGSSDKLARSLPLLARRLHPDHVFTIPKLSTAGTFTRFMACVSSSRRTGPTLEDYTDAPLSSRDVRAHRLIPSQGRVAAGLGTRPFRTWRFL